MRTVNVLQHVRGMIDVVYLVGGVGDGDFSFSFMLIYAFNLFKTF